MDIADQIASIAGGSSRKGRHDARREISAHERLEVNWDLEKNPLDIMNDCAVMNWSRRMFTNEGLLKTFLSLVFVLIVIYWPAIMIYLFAQTILVGIHGLVFAHGYKGALARGSGYVAIGVSVLVGVAVFVWETAIIIAAITRSL